MREEEAAFQEEPEIQVFSNNPVETEIHSDSSAHHTCSKGVLRFNLGKPPY